jgi:epoxide hydrolase-like predicted phosphatase
MTDVPEIKAVLFDFGGVLAEEGFKAGLAAIAEKNGIDTGEMVRTAFETVYGLGFVAGKVQEGAFWEALRQKTGIRGKDRELRKEVLSRFILRPWMLKRVSSLKKQGIILGILSDQCNWLDELNEKNRFFYLFDHVFNSYHMGLTKKDPGVFDHVLDRLKLKAQEVLFIDDHLDHIERASARGLQTLHYTDKDAFLSQLQKFLPGLRQLRLKN